MHLCHESPMLSVRCGGHLQFLGEGLALRAARLSQPLHLSLRRLQLRGLLRHRRLVALDLPRQPLRILLRFLPMCGTGASDAPKPVQNQSMLSSNSAAITAAAATRCWSCSTKQRRQAIVHQMQPCTCGGAAVRTCREAASLSRFMRSFLALALAAFASSERLALARSQSLKRRVAPSSPRCVSVTASSAAFAL